MIYAVAENGVIGKDGGMPWHIPSDLRRFRALTIGAPVIMGRKTYESIGSPLGGRTNIVLSRSGWNAPAGVRAAASVEEAIAFAGAENGERASVIGGAAIYDAFAPYADGLIVTYVQGRPDGDTYVDPVDQNLWRETSRTSHDRGPADEFPTVTVVYERVAGTTDRR